MTEQELQKIEKLYTETLVPKAPVRVHVEALIAEIRRLNEDNDRLNFKVKTLGEQLTDLCMQIADAPIVYGANLVITDPSSSLEFMGPNARVIGATHTARLVDIKKIGDKG